MKLLVALAASLVMASCAHTTPNGCTEYKPWCVGGGQEVCTTDGRGCQVCSCESTQRDGQVVPDRVADPYAPR